MDVHQTICSVDIAGYGGMARTRPNYVTLRSGMYESVQQAFDLAGIPWDKCFQQDVGDSILVLAPAHVPKGAFAGALPEALADALGAHNEAHLPAERIRLRLALHAGEVTYDRYGVAGKAIILASRLLDAPPLKEALRNSAGSLAMIASDWFYTEVIQHHDDYEPNAYRQVNVDVKETSDVGWIRVPGHELPAPAPSVRPVTEPVPPVVIPVRLRPASPRFYEVVDALEDIPCMRQEDTRSLVVDELPFAGTVRHFTARRAHVISILRTCLDFDNGLLQLVSVITNHEPSGSVPLNRLLTLLTGGAV
ncbi:effector-associated domain 2-containing protein [Actinophytocola sp.]|uniref:effector-associated domain 2-containing protein n=1 Tax=Actinophytocola sp. TaxID=1872138 RepID=UPI002ED33CD5